jgi:hypothetical protein
MSSSKFSGPFMQKSALTPLQGNAFIKAVKDAKDNNKTSFTFNGKNYPLKMEEESPLNIDPKKKAAYQDSIQKLHKPAYDKYVDRSKKGFYIDDTDSGKDFFLSKDVTHVKPRKPEDIKSLKDYAYAMEIGKGGSVTKDGVAASKLARMYK